MPKDYTQESEDETVLVVNELKTGLNLSKHYVIEVTSSSIGTERLKRENFSMLAYRDDSMLHVTVIIHFNAQVHIWKCRLCVTHLELVHKQVNGPWFKSGSCKTIIIIIIMI